jgi:hypothetical protein
MEAEHIVVEPIVPSAAMVRMDRVDLLLCGDPAQVDYAISEDARQRSGPRRWMIAERRSDG